LKVDGALAAETGIAKLEGALGALAAVPPAKGPGPKLAAAAGAPKVEAALGAEAAVPLVNEAAALKVEGALAAVTELKSAAGALKVDGALKVEGALKLEGALAAEAGAAEP
jgi:hypothetical protein